MLELDSNLEKVNLDMVNIFFFMPQIIEKMNNYE